MGVRGGRAARGENRPAQRVFARITTQIGVRRAKNTLSGAINRSALEFVLRRGGILFRSATLSLSSRASAVALGMRQYTEGGWQDSRCLVLYARTQLTELGRA